MSPIAIFRHVAHEGPGHFATFLERHGLPWTLIAIDRGDAVPASCSGFAGLVFMGGPMSVNDDLPWIAQELALIREAVAMGIPVLGHCLGGQLMAKALGGEIGRNPVKEIGWGKVWVDEGAISADWLGDRLEFEAFHWHGETFSLPAGASRLLRGTHCDNQAFVLGKHLGLQCHVEMTEAMVAEWCQVGADEIAAAGGPAVEPTDAILARTPSRLPAMQAVADRLYGHWIAGINQG